MSDLLKSKIGRLRIISMIEGLSLVILVFIGVPLKYMFALPAMVKIVGPIHGGLFLLFILMAILAAIEYGWKFKTTAIVLLSSLVPFGCFYVESKIFRNVNPASENNA
jgi:integral membrane protein